MNRTLKLSMLIALALGSSHAMAVSLGQARVKSALGQPLLVEVPLNPTSPAELRHLTVRLASSDAYARAGITDGRTAVPLHFAVINQAGGKAIRITSTAPIGEPYLDLLLEVNGGGSTSVREVAILLDPPGAFRQASNDNPAAAPSPRPAPANQAVAPARSSPAQSSPATTAPATSTASSAVRDGTYGPVQSGQTLTGIARKTLPSGVDLNQMMLAYRQANPDAFFRDNVNALKRGAVLRVPSAADAKSMAAAAALAEVRRQNSDWRAGSTSKPVALANGSARAASKQPAGGSAGDQADRLALVPATNGVKGAPSENAGAKGDSAKGLRQELLRSKESVASLQQQGEDLKTRLQDLNDINAKNTSLLALKDSEIADLQRKLAAARQAAHLPPVAPAGGATPAAAASASMAAASTTAVPIGSVAGARSSNAAMAPGAAAPMASTSSTAAGMSAMPSPASSAAASRPVAGTPAAKASPMPQVIERPWYMQTWAWAVAAGVVVLLLLLALLGRRRSTATSPLSGSSLADRFGTDAPPFDETYGAAVLAGGDADQDELLDQLAEHPDDIHLHLELVSLYYARRDVERFEAAAEAMYAHISDPQQDEWQDVVHMGEDLTPQHPLFAGYDEVPPGDAESGETFDIDDYAIDEDTIDADTTAIPPLPQDRPAADYSFDFDGAARESGEPPEAVAPEELSRAAAPDTDRGLNFDSDEFNDDPIDTKLDLARAYMDMGDADGARAMLDEVIDEGSQAQQDTARSLLDKMS